MKIKPVSILQTLGLFLFLLLLSHLFTGCGTTPQEKIASAATIARFSAFNASAALVAESDDPEKARANLRAVANDLRALESVENVRIADVALVAGKLPVSKLKSPYGRLAFINGMMVLVTWSNSSELRDADAKPVATALREGIEMEIGPPEVLQRASAPSVPVFSPAN